MSNRVTEDPSALGTVSINSPFMNGYSVVTLYDAFEGVTYDPLERMRFFDSFSWTLRRPPKRPQGHSDGNHLRASVQC
jgi:hypothetical protein